MLLMETDVHKYAYFTIHMEKGQVDRLAKYAADNDISVNALMSQCCEYALDHMKIETKR